MPLNKLPQAAEGSVQASKSIEDGVLASSLITAPAWGPWLSELNDILTTLSLLVGLAIGVYRLWRISQANSKPPSGNEGRSARSATTETTTKENHLK